MTEASWALHERQLRDPQQVVSLLSERLPHDQHALDADVDGPFWDIIGALGATILVTREYEHFALALSAGDHGPTTSVLRLPHPSGIAVDRDRGAVYIALTRNPNQVMELVPSSSWIPRSDRAHPCDALGLVPRATRIFPGCFYLHDLALVGGRLMGNAVGMNAVVDLSGEGPAVAWWPRSMDTDKGPDLSRNHMQLNSIAAGADLASSFFTASTEGRSEHPPGDPSWDVTSRGVIFSGRSREPIARGLTRPHSARLADDGRVWVADSGFGTVNVANGDQAVPVAGLPGWTRGMCLIDRYAIVGTSRVIPRFSQYAPGLDVTTSVCGLHAVDMATGRVEASLCWPAGNRIFAVDWIPAPMATGFLAGDPHGDANDVEAAWYHFCPPGSTFGPDTPPESH